MKKHIDSRAALVSETLVIAQIITLLNNNGYLVFRVPNSGSINASFLNDQFLDIVSHVANGALAPPPVKGSRKGKTPIESATKNVIQRSFRKVPGVVPGIWDVIGFNLYTGVVLAIEVKFGADILSEEQKVFGQKVRAAGGQTFVVKDFPTFSNYFFSEMQPRRRVASSDLG